MARFILSAFADEAGSTLEEQINALKENGVKYIEPRQINGKGVLDYSLDELREIAKILNENGIKVNSVGSPIGKYPIDDDFEPHLEKFKYSLEVAKVLGTDRIRMFSFYVTQDKLKEKRDEVIRRLKIMVSLANEAGIKLCHENESEIYGQMPAEVDDLLSNVEGLYGIFDAANYRMNNGDVMEGIKATMINFSYLHIKDAHYESQTILPAGEGEGKIADIINIINDNYDTDVYLTLEPHLAIFAAYKDIDNHELRGKYHFDNGREAFDFAMNTLKKLLISNGYKENNFVWTK